VTGWAFSQTACWYAKGGLQELIAIENQTELVIADASTQLVNEIESVINRSNRKAIERRKSTTTLKGCSWRPQK